MIALAKKVGMQEEARIRKVLYYNNIYYDSLKFGTIRSEWDEIKANYRSVCR